MKTAISIPDELFKEAEITAKQLGLARSQLYVKAINEFIVHHNKERITEKLNSIHSGKERDDGFADLAARSLAEGSERDSW